DILNEIVRRHTHYIYFVTDPATTDIYTLSLHDALPISRSKNKIHSRESADTAESPSERCAARAAESRRVAYSRDSAAAPWVLVWPRSNGNCFRLFAFRLFSKKRRWSPGSESFT